MAEKPKADKKDLPKIAKANDKRREARKASLPPEQVPKGSFRFE